MRLPRDLVIPVAILSAVSLVVACRVGGVPANERRIASDVERVWNAHMAVLERILVGKEYSLEEYASTVEFFERTTGLKYKDNASYVGRLPTDALEIQVKAWRAWYKDNAATLRVDPATGRLVASSGREVPVE